MFATLWAKLIGAGIFAVICLVALAVISRHWNCDKPRPPRPPRLVSLTVSRVLSGVAIEVTSGRRDRRTGVVNLSGVALPTDPMLAERSRISLEGLAGVEIRVETQRRFGSSAPTGDAESATDATAPGDQSAQLQNQEPWLLPPASGSGANKGLPLSRPGESADETDEATTRDVGLAPESVDPPSIDEATPGLFESVFDRGADYVGVVHGSGGELQTAQLKAGMVTLTDRSVKAWVAAEKEAKSKRLGVWK